MWLDDFHISGINAWQWQSTTSLNDPDITFAGGTALMVAAGKGRMADVMTRLSHGADGQLKARDGSTAADWAQRFGHT